MQKDVTNKLINESASSAIKLISNLKFYFVQVILFLTQFKKLVIL